MIDYKEMIERLKYYGTTYAIGDNLGREINGSDDLMLTAATAIETLLEERNTAVEDIHRDCITCAHSESNNKDHITCKFMEACRFAEHWEWRGTQKDGEFCRSVSSGKGMERS